MGLPLSSAQQKHIAILCLKFGEEHVLQKELAEYVFADLGVAVVTDMNWSGQVSPLPPSSPYVTSSPFPPAPRSQ